MKLIIKEKLYRDLIDFRSTRTARTTDTNRIDYDSLRSLSNSILPHPFRYKYLSSLEYSTS
jgi:hypothetical protein